MVEISATRLVSIGQTLEDLWLGADMKDVTPVQLGRKLCEIGNLFSELNWIDLKDQAQRIVVRGQQENPDWAKIHCLLEDLQEAYLARVRGIRIGIISQEDTYLLDSPAEKLAGPPVSGFPEIALELNMAGRCLAFECPTASVFHSVRAIEISLHLFAPQLGVAFPNGIQNQNWSVIVNNIKSKLSKIEQSGPQSETKSETLRKLAECLIDSDLFRLAWRNYVMHGKASFAVSESRKVLESAGRFLANVCALETTY